MLTLTVVFLFVSLVADALGLGGIALASAVLAKSFFVALLSLFFLLAISGPASVDWILGRYSRALLR